jgi:hypothetical protein
VLLIPCVEKGEPLVRRFATIALSFGLLLGLTGVHHLRAQDEAKKDATPPKSETAQPDAAKEKAKEAAPKPEAKEKEKEAAPKPDASAATEAPPPPIPPEVEAKLEAARRAVAEAIVAAEDAGLVKTTINPPPILDILITGRANDESTLKAKTGVSPEVFGAWFSDQGKLKDINPMKDVRIYNPTAGLKEFFDQRAAVLNRHIEAVRKASGSAKKDETPKKDEAPTDDAKKDKPKEDKPGGEG